MIRWIKTRILLVAALAGLILALPGCAYITGEAVTVPEAAPASAVVNVTPARAFELIYASNNSFNPVVLDVRTPQEFSEGHISVRIINIDFTSPSFRDEIGKLDKNKTYVVYCRTGARSAAASQVMMELGFEHIYNMTGGFTDWQAQGFPVTK
jgi:rhodanese-related sulfurtransferase